jgi:predicted RNA-binding protein with PIN domain
VVTRVIDEEGHETEYYKIIKNIIEYNFVGNKKIKIVFFNCDWFDPKCGTQENQFGMVEVKYVDRLSGCDPFILAHLVEHVYYMSYPCQKLNAWWVVYKVNPWE